MKPRKHFNLASYNFPLLLSCFLIIFLASCNKKRENFIEGDSSPETSDRTSITMDGFIGANAFVDDPVERMEALGFIREYHLWQWDEGNGDPSYNGYPDNEMQWSPNLVGWDFDQFYRTIHDHKLDIVPCLHGAAPWLQNQQNRFPTNDKPTDQASANTKDPRSYLARSHYLYQFAARYGSQQVDPSVLTLHSGQPALSGLNLVRYLEDWNEQDRNWEGPNAQFSPEEYAAMLSADYDGHGQQLGSGGKGTFGVKNADPNMKVVMGGLASVDVNYIEKMRAWFHDNRADQKFAADVINVHIYAWKNGYNHQGGGPALSPEEAQFKEKLQALTDYRDKHLESLEVWVSEFGWDTHEGSVLSPPIIGQFDRQEVQAQWLLRAYLAFAAAGVDRAQMYMLRDVDPNNPQWFSTSGLVTQKGEWTPKKSWYYVYTMKNTLTNMQFAGEVKANDDNILIYKFKDTSSDRGVYAIWAKTSRGYTATNYVLPIKGAKTAQAIEPTPNSTDGKHTTLAVANETVQINVSEKPLFISVDFIE
ncbi:hypothetical protein [Parapedobacter lycopersici]|uniref:hypothetical protein n=1 Tax=Parapedobacter lycopersici TaxID=1864939 RepID=UPI00214D6B6B|nr:hypothetical protein [Parapedobacter lycopersici]